MALDTFSPPIEPTVSSTKEISYNVLRADFGDGYSQRAADGLNNVRGS